MNKNTNHNASVSSKRQKKNSLIKYILYIDINESSMPLVNIVNQKKIIKHHTLNVVF